MTHKPSFKPATTTLRDVSAHVGRTGLITPVAMLDPVDIMGIGVASVRLHNFPYLREIDMRIGDVVEVHLSDGYTPRIEGVILNRRAGDFPPAQMPACCPECGTQLKVVDGDLVRYFCPNHLDCPAQHISMLVHFCSGKGMNIAGMSKAFIVALVERGYIKTVADIYTLQEHREELCKLNGHGVASIRGILSAIEESKQRPLHLLICALGIPSLGRRPARHLVREFADMDALLKAIGRVWALFRPIPIDMGMISIIGDIIANVPDDYQHQSLVELSRWLLDVEESIRRTGKCFLQHRDISDYTGAAVNGVDVKYPPGARQVSLPKYYLERLELATYTLKLLGIHFGDLGVFVESLTNYRRFRKLRIGRVRVIALRQYFSEQENLETIEQLSKLGVRMHAETDAEAAADPDVGVRTGVRVGVGARVGYGAKARAEPESIHADPNGALVGEVVLVTGKFDSTVRGKIQDACVGAGAIVVGTFSRIPAVTLLICGDKPGSNKVTRAKVEGIRTWDKATFYEKVPLLDKDSGGKGSDIA